MYAFNVDIEYIFFKSINLILICYIYTPTFGLIITGLATQRPRFCFQIFVASYDAGVWGSSPRKNFSVKNLISCILVNFYAPISTFSESIYAENIFM